MPERMHAVGRSSCSLHATTQSSVSFRGHVARPGANRRLTSLFVPRAGLEPATYGLGFAFSTMSQNHHRLSDQVFVSTETSLHRQNASPMFGVGSGHLQFVRLAGDHLSRRATRDSVRSRRKYSTLRRSCSLRGAFDETKRVALCGVDSATDAAVGGCECECDGVSGAEVDLDLVDACASTCRDLPPDCDAPPAPCSFRIASLRSRRVRPGTRSDRHDREADLLLLG